VLRRENRDRSDTKRPRRESRADLVPKIHVSRMFGENKFPLFLRESSDHFWPEHFWLRPIWPEPFWLKPFWPQPGNLIPAPPGNIIPAPPGNLIPAPPGNLGRN